MKIGNDTILGRIIKDVYAIEDVNEHIIVSNHKFVHIFEEWAAKQTTRCKTTIIDDGTEANGTRLSSVRDLLLAIDKSNVDVL